MTGRQFYDWQTAGGADDVMRMVDALERAELHWCAIGGIAVNHWAAEPMVTRDVDFVVAVTGEPAAEHRRLLPRFSRAIGAGGRARHPAAGGIARRHAGRQDQGMAHARTKAQQGDQGSRRYRPSHRSPSRPAGTADRVASSSRRNPAVDLDEPPAAAAQRATTTTAARSG